MNHSNEHIEQLRQELLSQDKSLGGQKETYIRLIERMSSHIPEVMIDKNFQNNLKSRLEYHIQHMTSSQSAQPAGKFNRLARLISYGLPTIALGVIIFLALPGTPNQVIAPTSDHSVINIESGTSQQDDISTNILQGSDTIKQTQIKNTNENQTIKSSPTETPTNSMMMQDSSNTRTQETTLQDNSQLPAPKMANTNLEPRNTQTFSDNNFSITYTLESAGDDIIIKGTLSDGNCKSQYNFSKTLVDTSKDGSITLSATLEGTKTSQSFSVKFQDNSIINIQGEHICQRITK